MEHEVSRVSFFPLFQLCVLFVLNTVTQYCKLFGSLLYVMRNTVLIGKLR